MDDCDRQMTWDEVVAENVTLKAEIEKLTELMQRQAVCHLDAQHRSAKENNRLSAITDALHNAINGLDDLVLDEGGMNNCERAAKKIRHQQDEIDRLTDQLETKTSLLQRWILLGREAVERLSSESEGEG